MRRILAFPLIAACLAMTACAALGGAASIVSAIQSVASVAGRPAAANQTAAVVPASTGGTIGDQVVMRGTQGLIVANNAYQTASALAEGYIRAGRSTPAQRQRIGELNDRAIALLETGAGGLTVAQRAAEVLNIVAELNLFGGRS